MAEKTFRVLISEPNPHSPLIDWGFLPQAQKTKSVNKSLSAISLPERFVGRRAEMRQYKNELLTGKIESLLITGPGGQGKTALARVSLPGVRAPKTHGVFSCVSLNLR